MNVTNIAKFWVSCRPLRGILQRFQGTYKTPEYEYHLIDKPEGPKSESTITKDEATQYLHDMWSIRRMETALSKMYQNKIVRGFCHLYNGQEAVAVGVFNRLRPQDTLITAYRAHGYAYLFSGRQLEPIIAELAGKLTGCAKGKGGSMHLYADRFYGGNGIVGAQVPIGTGIALAHKHLNTKGISITIYGDGASNQGQVFEAYNIAKLWVLPVIYIIENNMYAMGTHNSRGSANTLYYKSCSYIPGLSVDGMDVLAVREAIEYAIKYVSEGQGPIILEMRTYRYYGHSMSDPGSSYRSRDEIVEVRKTRDPIKKFQSVIASDELVSKEEVAKINKKVRTEVDEMVEKVTSGKELGVEHVAGDIVKNSLQDDIRGVSMLKPLKHKNFDPPK